MCKKHTFVICAYKESPYLEECIQSVIAQKEYSEVILATSTPNDHIHNLCEKYSISEYTNTGKSGITQDWEFAIRTAQTPVVTIAHQDDVYYEGYSECIVHEYDKRRRPLIMFSDYHEIRRGEYVKNNGLLRIKKTMLFPLRSTSLQSCIRMRRFILSFGSPICCPSVAYIPGNLPEPLFLDHFRTNEDWETWERISKSEGDFVYIHRPLMAHRIHSDSQTSEALDNGGRSAEDYEMYCKFWPGPIARMLTKGYKSSEKYNRIKIK